MQILDKDIRGAIFRRYRDSKRKVIGAVYTAFASLYAKCIGVTLGRNVWFYGKVTFDRCPYSQISIGDNCLFISSCQMNQLCQKSTILRTSTPVAKIEIGNNCGFSSVRIVSEAGVKIGDHVSIGANTVIYDTDGHAEITGNQPKPIVIEDDVFIGMDCHILKGVKIGRGSIIGACSVVTKDIPAGVIAAGVPCKVIREK
ncbi:MAG: acyltransferase [Bacteroidales bacterium]|nr:acyltransferase [Bacteroidales bacterium]